MEILRGLHDALHCLHFMFLLSWTIEIRMSDLLAIHTAPATIDAFIARSRLSKLVLDNVYQQMKAIEHTGGANDKGDKHRSTEMKGTNQGTKGTHRRANQHRGG